MGTHFFNIIINILICFFFPEYQILELPNQVVIS